MSDSYEYVRSILESAKSPDSDTTMGDFWRELKFAHEMYEITEGEFNKLRQEASPRLDCVSSMSDFIKDVKLCEGFTKAEQQISQFTGKEFVVSYEARSGVVIDLLRPGARLESIVRVVCSQQKVSVLLCSGDTLGFCQEHDISTLLAQDVLASFFDSLEPMCRMAGYKSLTVKGTGLYDSRWAERRGYKQAGADGKLEVWSKSFIE